MNEPKTILVELSPLEAAVIQKLRLYRFGDFTISKIDGEPRRVVIGGSEMLSPEDGEKLRYNNGDGIRTEATTKSGQA